MIRLSHVDFSVLFVLVKVDITSFKFQLHGAPEAYKLICILQNGVGFLRGVYFSEVKTIRV